MSSFDARNLSGHASSKMETSIFFIMSPLHPSSKPQLRVSLGLLTVELLERLSNCSDNSSDVRSTTRILASTAWLPMKLVESLLLMVSSKLDSSDKLKTMLLSEYKVLGD